MKRITVFCGSSLGKENSLQEQASALGKTLVQKNIELVYGGAKIGLMGLLADGVLESGGMAIGVIPSFLRKKEVAHHGLSELHIVESMHERKTKMNELCDGVIALPGGFGTLEELFEMLTWKQLGLHNKPIGLLNVNGFYDQLIEFIDQMAVKGFIKEGDRHMILSSDNANDLIDQMKNYKVQQNDQWIKPGLE